MCEKKVHFHVDMSGFVANQHPDGSVGQLWEDINFPHFLFHLQQFRTVGFVSFFKLNKLFSSLSVRVCLFVFTGIPKRVCEGKGACGEEARVLEASQTAADWERVNWLFGVDL